MHKVLQMTNFVETGTLIQARKERGLLGQIVSGPDRPKKKKTVMLFYAHKSFQDFFKIQTFIQIFFVRGKEQNIFGSL